MALLILFGVVAVSRFMFWQISIWEWDEILFSNALHKFNVWEHSPHPPGYPGYVALTRGLNYFLHNDLKALVFVNVFFGSLLVFPLYFFYRHFSSHLVALGAAALSLFNPPIWFYSESGYNDVTSLFWVITSLALLYRYESNRSFYLGMLSLGMAMSVRPQNVLFGILLAPLLLGLKVRRGERKAAGIGLGLLVGMCLVWFAPLVRSAGGLGSYMELLRRHGKNETEDLGYLTLRHQMSLMAFAKTKFLLLWGSRGFGLLLAGLTILGVGTYLWRGKRKAFLLLVVGFLPSALVDFLWLHLYYPKYTISTTVLVSFFIVYGLWELWPRSMVWKKFLAPAMVLGLVLFSVQWTLPAVRYLHTIKSPLAQLFDYVRQHLDPKADAIIYDSRIKNLLPEFVIVSTEAVDEEKVKEVKDRNWYYMGIPLPGLLPQVKFSVDSERRRYFGGTLIDLWLTKTNVLYSNDYEWSDLHASWYPLNPEGHCFLKNNGRAKILALEGALSPGQHALPVSLELDGQSLIETEIKPHGQFYPFFVLNEPPDKAGPFSTLTVRTSPPEPGDALVIKGVYWWDLEPAPASETQVIDFNPGAKSVMVSGWSGPETDGEQTFAWSTDRASVLAVRLRPRSFYELSFRAAPITNPQAPNVPQTITICMGDVCGPELKLDSDWQTYTRVLLSPTTRAEENVRLSFYYRFTYSPTLENGDKDPRSLGVAFNYIKLTWLGNRWVETPLPPAK